MRGPTGVKFCTMVSTRPSFIMPVQNFEGHTPKNFRNQKHAKFIPISDDFKVWRRISSEKIKTFKIGFLFRLPRFFLSRETNSVKFGLVRFRFRCEIVPTKSAYFGKTYFGPQKIHALENDQVLLAHFPPGTAVFLTTFLKRGQNWLKM